MLSCAKRAFLSAKTSVTSQSGRRLLTQRVNVSGVNIAYEKVGEGPAIVAFLPGALGTARTDFQPQLENLDRRKFTLVSWDPPGYGASRPPERDFNNYYRKDADLFAKLMTSLGHEKYSVVGWSDGAITALILASMKPESIVKLVSIAGQAFVTEHDRKLTLAIEDVNKWSPRAREPLEKVYGRDKLQALWSGVVRAMCSYDDLCKEELSKIVCPTLIVQGEKDPLVPSSHSEFLFKNIKDACLYKFPEGSHNVHLRFYKEFNVLLEKFLLD